MKIDFKGCPFGFSEDEAQKRMPTWLRISADKVVAHEGAHASGHVELLRWLADRIESATKPPRIPEPGLWGVVEASCPPGGYRWQWVHHPKDVWLNAEGEGSPWSDLIDPILIREGLS